MSSPTSSASQQGAWLPRFLQGVGIVVGTGLALLVIWRAADILLLAFGGVLFAVLLRGISCRMHNATKMPMGVCLTIAVLFMVVFAVSAIRFLSPPIAEQAQELQTTVVNAVGKLQEQVGDWPFFELLPSAWLADPEAEEEAPAARQQPTPAQKPGATPAAQIPAAQQQQPAAAEQQPGQQPQEQSARQPEDQAQEGGAFRPDASTMKDLFTGGAVLLRRVAGVFSTAFGAIAAVLIVILIGLFFAANPEVYRNGFLRLLPIRNRKRVADVLDETAHVLRWWLLGQLVAMIVVGSLVTIGLWLLGVPLAPVLGLISAILTFVPYLGPIVSAIPGLLIAWSVSPTLLLYTLILYVVVENLEGSVITPLIQQRAVKLAPGLIIGGQMLAGVVWGVLGIVFATPLLAAAQVVIKRLYVEDVLGDSLEKPAVRESS